MRPQPTDRDVGRARAGQIDRLIDISEVLAAPARPVAQWAVAAVLSLAGLAWAVIGSGATSDVEIDPDRTAATLTVDGAGLASQPLDLDLNERVTVTGLTPGTQASISFTQMGLPVGSTDTVPIFTPDAVEFDPGFLGRVTSGAMTATIEITDPGTGAPIDEVEFDVTGQHPWFLTAAGSISVLLVLFALAGVESNLRAFRRGRGRIASFLGLAVTGGLVGGATAAACTIVLGADRGLAGLIGPAALSAAGAVAMGLATRASRRRRRAAKQELRRTAITALASR